MVRLLSILALLLAFSQPYAQLVPPGGDGGLGGGGGIDPPPPGGDPTGKIPEPGTLALFGLGIVAVGLMSRKRRK